MAVTQVMDRAQGVLGYAADTLTNGLSPKYYS